VLLSPLQRHDGDQDVLSHGDGGQGGPSGLLALMRKRGNLDQPPASGGGRGQNVGLDCQGSASLIAHGSRKLIANSASLM